MLFVQGGRGKSYPRVYILGLDEYIINDSSMNSYLYISLQRAFTCIMPLHSHIFILR